MIAPRAGVAPAPVGRVMSLVFVNLAMFSRVLSGEVFLSEPAACRRSLHCAVSCGPMIAGTTVGPAIGGNRTWP